MSRPVVAAGRAAAIRTAAARSAAIGALLFTAHAAAAPKPTFSAPTRPSRAAQFPTPRAMTIEVLATHPHDRAAYTQGLVWEDGTLWESTGLNGQSSLRRVEPATGAVLQQRDIGAAHFAEGLARVGDRLIQLTWRTGRAFIWDKRSFEPLGEIAYGGEGWGLCHNGTDLIMSDGSDTLFIRDATTFAIKDRVPVQIAGEPLANLNELECFGDAVYANVWRETFIVRIDLATGDVIERIDGAPLDNAIRVKYGFNDPYDCLNGIAHVPEGDRFLVTGKHWPELYEVRFRATGGEPTGTPSPSGTSSATSLPTATATATPTSLHRWVIYLPWSNRSRR